MSWERKPSAACWSLVIQVFSRPKSNRRDEVSVHPSPVALSPAGSLGVGDLAGPAVRRAGGRVAALGRPVLAARGDLVARAGHGRPAVDETDGRSQRLLPARPGGFHPV